MKQGKLSSATAVKVSILLLMFFIVPLLACGQPQPATPGGKTAAMEQMTLEQSVAKADWIVTCYVLSADTQKDAASGKINTFFTASVREWLKGNNGQGNVIIKVPGGVIGSERQEVEGAQGFSTGETALVYLTANSDGTGSLLGGLGGKVRISGGTSQDLVGPGGGTPESLINSIKSIVSKEVRQ